MSQIPKRIALVCFSHSLGGLELSVLRLAETMRKKGVTIWIVAPPSSPLAIRAQEMQLAFIPLSPRWKYGDLLAAQRLARVWKEHRIEVVILMQSKDLHLAALASIFAPQTQLVFYQQMQSGYNKRDLAHTWVYSKLSLWVTLTERMKADVLAFTRVPEHKIAVVPLGIDLSDFNPALYSHKQSKEALGLPPDRLTIGVLGRLDPQKGQETLLRAIPAIMKQHPEVYIVIAGDETAGESGYKKYLEDLSQTLGIEKAVQFLPFVDNVPRFMAALDIFVLPSYSETFGLVLVEAMAMEKPIVATNAGGVPEIIADGITGILIEPRNTESLAYAILRILNDNTLGASLGRAARETALQRYNLNTCVDTLLAVLSKNSPR
ncbi:MAG TPA: glycosyltransferase family 4 protein [Bacteroidota bacterium]